MSKNRIPLWAPVLVMVAAVLLVTLSIGGTDAAKGGNGNGGGCKGGPKHCGTTSTVTLTVTPNPVPLGTNITIAGSGFGAYQDVLINTSHLPSPQVTADAGGNFSFVYDYQYGPGNASVQAYVFERNDWVLVATVSFAVCSTNPC